MLAATSCNSSVCVPPEPREMLLHTRAKFGRQAIYVNQETCRANTYKGRSEGVGSSLLLK